MKIPKRLYITKELCEKLKKSKGAAPWKDRYDHKWYYNAALFLLGTDKNGIIVRAEKLKDQNGGCEWMPKIGEKEIRRAYLKLAKAGLTPGGFAHILPENLRPWIGRRWSWAFGKDIRTHVGQPFIRFSPDPIAYAGINNHSITTQPIRLIVKRKK